MSAHLRVCVHKLFTNSFTKDVNFSVSRLAYLGRCVWSPSKQTIQSNKKKFPGLLHFPKMSWLPYGATPLMTPQPNTKLFKPVFLLSLRALQHAGCRIGFGLLANPHTGFRQAAQTSDASLARTRQTPWTRQASRGILLVARPSWRILCVRRISTLLRSDCFSVLATCPHLSLPCPTATVPAGNKRTKSCSLDILPQNDSNVIYSVSRRTFSALQFIHTATV